MEKIQLDLNDSLESQRTTSENHNWKGRRISLHVLDYLLFAITYLTSFQML
jgi:hypothetical protein